MAHMNGERVTRYCDETSCRNGAEAWVSAAVKHLKRNAGKKLFLVEVEKTHNPLPIRDFRSKRQMLEARHFMKLILESGLGIRQQLAQRGACSDCWEPLRGHKWRNYILDNDLSPAYNRSVKLDRLRAAKDRLQTEPPIIC